MKRTEKKKRLQEPGHLEDREAIQIAIRWPREAVAAIDAWRKQQPGVPARSAAIRRLVEQGLTVNTVRSRTRKSQERAAVLAEDVLDNHADQTATHQQRIDRKRRLIKGPSTFRDFRKD
jgi:hypothetical protein